jgi:putative membrane-bound dehydrogenase-like protein
MRALVFGSFAFLLLSTPRFTVAAQLELNGQTFTLADGFEIEVVAKAPLIERPIVADFDEAGRLYVADSSGSNDKVEKQLADRPHRIIRLEDTDGDGRFDRRTVFADQLMFPEGTMWFRGALYVAAPPSIWKFTDTDNDGVADRREEWFKGMTLTGCANDLHGPYRGPDGWIYWCKGAFAKQTHQVAGKPFVTRASHIFRARPDGSGLEPVMTGGMDNPVDVVFTADGERICSATFLQQPAGGRRDGLFHAVYGGVYGKQHDVLDGHVRTGELMPVMAHLGPAAPCGLVCFRGKSFGEEFENNLFAALFNLHKITRHQLSYQGAALQSRDEDFLSAVSPDFHPTDVIEDADGSLLILDTGGWYKLCCPTSQLHKPDVLGAIYRVRKKGAAAVADPRGASIAWSTLANDALARLLGDARPSVRDRAIETLAGRGNAAIEALRKALDRNNDVEMRRNALWTLTRIDAPAARTTVHDAFKDDDSTVRHVAAHSVAISRDTTALSQLLELSREDRPELQRAAAEALGRLGDATAVPSLLAASRTGDRVLDHSIIYALVELGDPIATAAALHAGTPAARKNALIALDQMEGGQLPAAEALAALKSNDAELKKAALWVVAQHPEWGDQLVPLLADQLATPSTDDLAARTQVFSRLAEHPAVQQLLASTARNPAAVKAVRLFALRAMAAARLKNPGAGWADALRAILDETETELLTAAAEAVRAQPDKLRDGLSGALLGAASRRELPPPARVALLDAVRGPNVDLQPQQLQMLRELLAPDVDARLRGSAARLLGSARLNADAQRSLLENIRTAGPFELSKLLGAFDNCQDAAIGLSLVDVLAHAPGLSSLGAGGLRSHLGKFPPAVLTKAEPLFASLGADPQRQRARLDELAVQLSAGDVRRGHSVFHSPKAGCVTCHAMGYVGGTVGPDLTRIGQIRTERDLLEAIVFPSASFVRSYEPTLITTKSGDIYNGNVREDSGDTLLLAIGAGTEVRVARTDIAEMQPGMASLMPQGFDQILTPGELADLVAFLKAAR